MAIFEPGSLYSFTLYPSAVLGQQSLSVEVLGVIDFSTANQLDRGNIAAKHATVFPYLPAGTPDDPTATNYVYVRDSDGKNAVYGISWINLTTVKSEGVKTISITLYNRSVSDLAKIRNILSHNGELKSGDIVKFL
jgi:hypothetical protein